MSANGTPQGFIYSKLPTNQIRDRSMEQDGNNGNPTGYVPNVDPNSPQSRYIPPMFNPYSGQWNQQQSYYVPTAYNAPNGGSGGMPSGPQQPTPWMPQFYNNPAPANSNSPQQPSIPVYNNTGTPGQPKPQPITGQPSNGGVPQPPSTTPGFTQQQLQNQALHGILPVFNQSPQTASPTDTYLHNVRSGLSGGKGLTATMPTFASPQGNYQNQISGIFNNLYASGSMPYFSETQSLPQSNAGPAGGGGYMPAFGPSPLDRGQINVR